LNSMACRNRSRVNHWDWRPTNCR